MADDALTRLRSLVYTGDGAGLVSVLAEAPWRDGPLQLIGDGLYAAVRAGVEGAPRLAVMCAAALGERNWEGDRELADALTAAVGTAPAPSLLPLAVNLDELASILEGDPAYGGGQINLTTGEVWPQPAIEYALETGESDEDHEDPGLWLWVSCEGSREGYRDMVVFIGNVEDALVADRLSRAIAGRGAFRRFKDALAEDPGLMSRWFAFSDERQRGRAREWLAAAGYTTTPTT